MPSATPLSASNASMSTPVEFSWFLTKSMSWLTVPVTFAQDPGCVLESLDSVRVFPRTGRSRRLYFCCSSWIPLSESGGPIESRELARLSSIFFRFLQHRNLCPIFYDKMRQALFTLKSRSGKATSEPMDPLQEVAANKLLIRGWAGLYLSRAAQPTGFRLHTVTAGNSNSVRRACQIEVKLWNLLASEAYDFF